RTLREPRRRRRLNRRLRLTPLSEKEWNAVRNAMTAREAMADAGTDPVERAAHFYVWSRQSRSGLRGDFTGITKTRLRGGRNGDVNAWRNAVEDLDAVAERLLDVVMLDRPAVDVIRSQDGPATEFYLDPTYYPGTRTSPDAYGEYEMTEADHHDLLTVLAGIRGRFLLSGYAHPVYDDFAARQGWDCVCRDVPDHAAGGQVKQRMLECVWLNYPPPASALTWWSVRVWAGRPDTFDVVIEPESDASSATSRRPITASISAFASLAWRCNSAVSRAAGPPP